MNIFWVPSWYPGEDDDLLGIFIQEQAYALSQQFKDINLGISLWGQGQERFLLWAKDHIKNLMKIQQYKKLSSPKILQKHENFFELHYPVLSWSKKFLGGNFKKVLRANQLNYKAFEKNVGKVDLIHAQVSHPALLIAQKLSNLYQVPYLMTEHMSPFPFESILNNQKLKKNYSQAFEKSSANIGISPSLVNKMEAMGIKNTQYIPEVSNETFFSPAQQQHHRGYFQFFTLSRMEQQKGIPILLKAIQKVIQKAPLVVFRIGGDGSQWAKYQAMATELGISAFINWLGKLSPQEARKEFRECDAFVLSSLHETFGVVFSEAIACGKPIIGTRCGGPECIIHEKNGFLVEVEDIDGLSTAMLNMIQYRDNFSSDIIRQDFLNRFSRPVVAKQIKEVYEKIINGTNKNK